MSTEQPSAPGGFCQCGCGERTPLAPYNSPRRGYVKGKPLRYVSGHYQRGRVMSPDYEVNPETGCWLWLKRLSTRGYPVIARGERRNRYAHRVYYETHVGPVPDGHVVHHRCGTPRCVNPDHLEALDSFAHRQLHYPGAPTDEQVREIRARSARGEKQIDLAAEFGVSQPTISLIVRRRTRADVL